MSERFKERITVSAEVKTYLKDLYHQIEYELREDYDDALEKALNTINKIREEISYMSTNTYTEDYDIKQEYWIKLNEILGDKENEL